MVIAGDYGDPLKYLDGVPIDERRRVADRCFAVGYRQAERVNLFHWAMYTFADISDAVLMALAGDPYLRRTLQDRLRSFRRDDYLSAELRNKVYAKEEQP